MVKGYHSELGILSPYKFTYVYSLSGEQDNIAIKTLTMKIGHINKLVPSLLPNQFFISLTSQEDIPRQEIAPLDPPPLGFEPQMQLATVQGEI